MISEDLLAEARDAIASAAQKIRALPDVELVQLAMGGIVADIARAPRPAFAPVRPGDSGVFRLPMLEIGVGDRRNDCAEYGGCLDRFVKQDYKRSKLPGRGKDLPSGNGDIPARCPKACPSFLETPSHVRHGLAIANGRTLLSLAAER